MINALHLLWVCPLSASVGVVIMAVLAVGKSDENSTGVTTHKEG